MVCTLVKMLSIMDDLFIEFAFNNIHFQCDKRKERPQREVLIMALNYKTQNVNFLFVYL
jgi:hypothetical protein